MRRPVRKAANHTIAAGTSALMFILVYLVVVNSLKTDVVARSMGVGLPDDPQFSNYDGVIEEGKRGRALFTSVLYTVSAVVLCVLCAAGAAAVLAGNSTRLNRFIYMFLVSGIAMPTNYLTLTKVMQLTH